MWSRLADGWSVTEPFVPLLRDGKLYGRGTCDDKGPAVAALYAMRAVRELNISLKYNVRLILGADEETGAVIPTAITAISKKHPVLIRRTESIPSSTWKRAAYIRAIQVHGKRKLCFPASEELTAVRLAMRSPVRQKLL